MSSPAIEAIEVTTEFTQGSQIVPVLRGCSMAIHRGEVVALEGPSGSGKSTFLSVLGCILSPTSGKVVVNGELSDAKRQGDLARLRRRHLGFVFQQFNLFEALTASENVQLALDVRGQGDHDAKVRADRALDLVGLSERRRLLPRDLSGGQKQRVAIARAIVAEPAVVSADEPTASVDSKVGLQVLELFRSLAKERSCGVLIVTHNPKVRPFADRVIEIEDGRIVA